MKVAEALAERADIQKRLDHIRSRAEQVARIQEGDVPDEDPQALVAEAERLFERLQELVARINRTNTATPFAEGMSVTDAIAERDLAARRRSFYEGLAAAASARQDRYSRSEVRFVSTINVPETRSRADAAGRHYRELDTRLQQLNWSTELL